MSNLLSVREAADQLGVSPALLYALCHARKIRHERHGLRRGVIRIPTEALAEYQASVTVLAVVASGVRPPSGDLTQVLE